MRATIPHKLERQLKTYSFHQCYLHPFLANTGNKTKGTLWNLTVKALTKQFKHMKFKQIQRDSNTKQNEDPSVINNKGERIRAFIFLGQKF